jgi:UDP-N-acetylmuramoyl-tripeptide--D-alanyl-D-alanine ligase
MATPIPDNRAAFQVEELVQICSAKLQQGRPDQSVAGVFTDTRAAGEGKLFVALAGEHFDGHAFVQRAIEAGAAAVMVQRAVEAPPHVAVIVVADTLTALGQIARAHRRRWKGRVVAVAGSAGKTTTKATIAAALGALWPGRVHVTRGNLNNHVGVPMVLLALSDAHHLAVVEIGTNQPGEVEALSKMAEPDLAVLTLVAIEHSEGLGDLDAIEREEATLFNGLKPAGVIVVNHDDSRALRSARATGCGRIISYGTAADADYRLTERVTLNAESSRVRVARPKGDAIEATVPLLGAPAALAIAAAVAVADALCEKPASATSLAAGLSSPEVAESGRMRPVELPDGTLVLDDSYNANPVSVLAALATARELGASRSAALLLVLGEMRELGDLSEREHRQLGEAVAKTGARGLVAISGHARFFVPPALAAGIDAVFVEDAAAALPAVRQRLSPGSVVLVKASRGVHADQVVDGLRGGNGRAA